MVWIIGHSLIRRLGEFVQQRGITATFRPVWEGIGGAGIQRTRQAFLQLLARRPEPACVLVHSGSNDLAEMSAGALRHRIVELLALMKAALPRATIIWSDMLPRVQYRGATSSKKVCIAGSMVNRYVRNFAVKNGMRVVKHRAIRRDLAGMYMRDGVHLSDLGNAEFLREIWGAIEAFANSDMRIYEGIH